jgi:hypothetical protein
MLQVLQPGPRSRTNSTEKSEAQSNPSGIQIAARRDFSEDSMKSAFLLMVVPALLVALGFAQTPAPSSDSGNTDQVNIKGCLGGSDGNYTIAEDNTGKIFKITTSSADLKAYLGQDVNLTGNKAAAGDNSLAVTALNMISEHCAAAAAAPAAIVSAPAESVNTPPAAAQPAAEPASIVATPAVAAAPASDAPAAIVSTPSETASAPATATHRRPSSARPRKAPATPAAAPAPAEPASTPVADAAAVAPAGPPSATANAPAAPAAPATKASTSGTAAMFVSIIVVVLLIGGGVPLYNRWRKRKLLEQTRGQNLSFTKDANTKEVKSDPGKSDTTGGQKAA